MSEARWYVARTQARREPQVESILSLRGIEVYLPRILGSRKDDSGKRLHEPLFPGYVFARLVVPSNEWLAARSAPGVKYFLGTKVGTEPSAVPSALVDEIRRQCDLRARDGWRPGFAPGQKVRICSGPFAGLEAVFERLLTPAGRSRVLIEFLTRLVPVEIEVDLLQKAG